MRRSIASAVLLATVSVSLVLACSSEDPGASSSSGGAPPDAAAPQEDAGVDADASDPIGTRAVRGSRLAPRFQESADGFSAFVGIADTAQGNGTCTPKLASDGVLRCLPEAAVEVREPSYFSDSGCTKRLAETPADCKAPTLGFVSDGKCVESITYFELGAEHTGKFYLKDGDGACVETDADTAVKYYPLGNVKAPSSFVKLTRVEDNLGGGLGVMAYDGEDGSHFPTAVTVDRARKEQCEADKAIDGKSRCVPVLAGTVVGFTESTCSVRAAEYTPSCDPAEKASTAFDRDENGLRVYPLEASLGKQKYFVGTPGACKAEETEAVDLWRVGAPLPADTFPLLDEGQKGGTRLVATFPVANGTALPAPKGFRDLSLATDCEVAKGTDGKQRCLPTLSAPDDVFSDAACSKRIILVRVGSKPGKYLSESSRKSCDAQIQVRVFALTGPKTPAPTSVYTRGVIGCSARKLEFEADTYEVGEEVPPSTFVEVTDVVK